MLKYWNTQRKIWNEEERGGRTFKIYSMRLSSALANVTKSLEVGFGDGRWIKYLTDNGIKAYGIDILKKSVEKLKKEGYNVSVADARQLPFSDNTFDLTFSFGVIEHFEGTKKAAEEHIRVTKPNGKIIITSAGIYRVCA